MTAMTGSVRFRRRAVATSLAVLRSLLARLRVDLVVAMLIGTVVVATAALVAALPRQIAVLTNQSLADELSRTPVQVRSLTAETLHAPMPPAGAADPFDVVRTFGQAHAEESFPPQLQEIVRDPLSVMDTIRFTLRAYPGEEETAIGRNLTLRLQDGIEDHMTVTSGTLPEPSNLILTGPPDEEHPPPLTNQGEVLRVVDGLVPGDRVPVVQLAITQATADRLTLEQGDRILGGPDFSDPLARNLSAFSIQTVAFEVSAIIELTEPGDEFWFGDQRLHVAAQRDTGVSTDFFAFAMIPTENLPAVPGVRDHNLARIQWRYPVEPGSITASNVDAVRTSVRALEAQSAELLTAPGIVIHRTGLTRVLDQEVAQRQVATNALALAALAVAGVALTAIGLIAVLVAVRRRDATALIRGRGASRTQLLATEFVEAVAIALPAGVAGWFVAAWFAGGPSVPAATIGVGLVVLGAVVVLVAATVPDNRRPLRELLRDQVRAPRRSVRRIILEILVVVLAVVGVFAMRRRGVDLEAGSDPLVAAVPILVAVAAGLSVVRLHRVPIAAAALAASRRRGLALAYGLRRAVRDRSNGPAVLVVLLAVSVAVFSSAVDSTIRRGQEVASWERVGAPALVSVTEGQALTGLEELPGVTSVSYAQRRSASATGGNDITGRVDVVLIDPATLAPMSDGTPGAIDLPASFGAEAGDIDPDQARPTIPAIASGRWFQDTRLRRGSLVSVLVGGETVAVQVVAVRDRLLGLDAGERPFLIVPRDYTAAVLGQDVVPNAAFVAGDDVGVTAVGSHAMALDPGAELRVRDDILGALRERPLVHGVQTGFRLSALLALFLGALALVVVLTITSRDRIRDLALLTTTGSGPRQGLAITVVEVVPPILMAVLAGAFLGQVTGDLLDGVLDLSPFTGTPTASRVVSSTGTTLLAAGVIGAACLLIVFVVAIRAQRRDVTRVLREGTA
jgi:putative ABC transport system permease protein